MGTREFTLTLPEEVAKQLLAGEVDRVSAYVSETVHDQIRQEAIRGYLDICEEAGHAPLTDNDLAEFRKLVGEEAGRGGSRMRYYWIYDTPALVGHAHGTSPRVRAGLQLLLEEPDFRITLPATCLLEAYAETSVEYHHLLDGLAVSPGVSVEPVGTDLPAITAIGQLVHETGRPGAAHAAQIALAGNGPCLVFSDTRMPTGVLSRPA